MSYEVIILSCCSINNRKAGKCLNSIYRQPSNISLFYYLHLLKLNWGTTHRDHEAFSLLLTTINSFWKLKAEEIKGEGLQTTEARLKFFWTCSKKYVRICNMKKAQNTADPVSLFLGRGNFFQCHLLDSSPLKIKASYCRQWKMVLSISPLRDQTALERVHHQADLQQMHHLSPARPHTHSLFCLECPFWFHPLLWEICATSAANCSSVQQLFNQKAFIFFFSFRDQQL